MRMTPSRFHPRRKKGPKLFSQEPSSLKNENSEEVVWIPFANRDVVQSGDDNVIGKRDSQGLAHLGQPPRRYQVRLRCLSIPGRMIVRDDDGYGVVLNRQPKDFTGMDLGLIG